MFELLSEVSSALVSSSLADANRPPLAVDGVSCRCSRASNGQET